MLTLMWGGVLSILYASDRLTHCIQPVLWQTDTLHTACVVADWYTAYSLCCGRLIHCIQPVLWQTDTLHTACAVADWYTAYSLCCGRLIHCIQPVLWQTDTSPPRAQTFQGRIKLFGAPRQWKHFRPLFQAVFLSRGGEILPPRLSQTPRLPVPRQK